MSIFRRISNLFSLSKVGREIDAELTSHIEMRTMDNIAAGMSPEEARRDAQLRFGNPTVVKERTTAADTALFLDSVRSVFRYRDSGANLMAVFLLSFGLGAATLLFTALDRLLLRPLGVPHPERLVRAAIKRPKITVRSGFSYDTYHAARLIRSFRDVAAEADFDTSLAREGSSQSIFAQMVSGAYFQILNATPVLGRSLEPRDERTSPDSVPVVLSYGLWTRHFGRSPTILGAVIHLQGVPFTIVGVMPQRFLRGGHRYQSRSLVAARSAAVALGEISE